MYEYLSLNLARRQNAIWLKAWKSESSQLNSSIDICLD